MKCDSEVKFGVGGIFLPINWLFVLSKKGTLISKIWSGLAFCINSIQEITLMGPMKSRFVPVPISITSNAFASTWQQQEIQQMNITISAVTATRHYTDCRQILSGVARESILQLGSLVPKKFKQFVLLLTMLLTMMLGVAKSFAATYRYSVASGNWSSVNTWSTTSGGTAGASVPMATDNVIIERGYTVAIDINTAVCTSITIGSSINTGMLMFNSGSQVTVSGTIILGSGGKSGSINMTSGGILICNLISIGTAGSTFTCGTGTIQLNATNALPSTVFTSFNNLTINGGTSTLGVGISIAGALTLTGGTFAMSSFNVTNVGSLIMTGGSLITGTGTMTLGGNVTASSTSTAVSTISAPIALGSATRTFTVNQAGGWPDLKITSVISGAGGIIKEGTGTFDLWGLNTYSGITTINAGSIHFGVAGGASSGPLGALGSGTIVNPGGNLDLNAYSESYNEALTLNGTGQYGDGALKASGGSGLTYAGPITLGGACIISTGITLSGGITGGQDLTIVGSGTLSLGSSAATIGNLTISSGTLTSTSGLLNIAGNFTNNGTFTHNGGTINFNGSGAQSIGGSASTTFNTVTINKSSGTVSLLANQSIAGNLTVSAGTLDLSGYTMNRTAAGGTLTLSNGAALTIGGNSNFPSNYTANTLGASSMVGYDLNGAQTVAALTYGNLVFSGSGSKTVANGTSVAGNLSISGATANINAGITVPANSLSLGGSNKINGTWGSTSSTATNKDNTYFASTGIVNVTNDSRLTPNFSGLTASPGICFSDFKVTLSGTVSIGSNYPLDGETVGVSINGGATQNATILGGTGGFSIDFPTASIPASGSPYTITYAYTGNGNLKPAPNNTSTALTVNSLPTTSVYSQTNINCNGGTGSLTIMASGGSGSGYEFSKDNGSTGSWTSGASNPYPFTELHSNTQYKIRVIDDKGCASPAIQ